MDSKKTPRLISREHATIKHIADSNEYVLTSTKAVNGVLVNDTFVQRVS